MVHLTEKAIPPFSVHSHQKSRPSRPVPTLGSQTTGMIAEITENIDSLSDIPQSQEYFYTTVVVNSTRESASLPFNVFLGSVRTIQDADHKVLADAAEFTASQVANQWFALSVSSYSDFNQASDHVPNLSKPNCTRDYKVSHAQKNLQDSLPELDSSFLAPYLEPLS